MRTVKLLKILTGLILILVSTSMMTMATIIIDTQPPNRIMSTPAASGVYSSLSAVSIVLTDSSGVAQVTYNDFYESALLFTSPLTLTAGTINDGTWSVAFVPPPEQGPHAFQFVYTDKAGVNSAYVGNYIIYTQLEGDWEVKSGGADPVTYQIITASSTFYSSVPTIDFRFTATSVHPTLLTCTVTVTSGGTGSIALVENPIASGIYLGSMTFPGDGTYVVECKADDGYGTPITASLIDIGYGDEEGIYSRTSINQTNVVGVCLFVVGAMIIWSSYRERDG